MGQVYRTKRQTRLECDERLPGCMESTNWLADSYLNHTTDWALADGWTRRLSPRLMEAVVNETSIRPLLGDKDTMRIIWACHSCSQRQD